jgi:hypothetical protein
MTRQERLSIAQKQGVLVRAIYGREKLGWTDDEIRAGFHTRVRKNCYKPMYVPRGKLLSKFYSGKNGRGLFKALIIEVSAAIAQIDIEDMCAIIFGCYVYQGLQDKDS